MWKIFSSDKEKVTKNALFFLLRAPAHHSYTFNSRFLYELKHNVRLSKSMRGIFNFRFCFVFISKVFSTKNIDSLTSNRHNSFEDSNDRKATQNFALSPLFLSCNNKFWCYICVMFAMIFVWVGALQKRTRRQISKYLTALYLLTHLLW